MQRSRSGILHRFHCFLHYLDLKRQYPSYKEKFTYVELGLLIIINV